MNQSQQGIETGKQKMNTFKADTINIYKTPGQDDQVRFADGSLWTIKQRQGMSWGLYDADNYLHSAIGLHDSMLEFCASINAQGRFVANLLAGATAATGEN